MNSSDLIITFEESVVEDYLEVTPEAVALSLDGDENNLVLADSENYSKRDLRVFAETLRNVLEAMVYDGVERLRKLIGEEQKTRDLHWISVSTPPVKFQEVIVWNKYTKSSETAVYRDGRYFDTPTSNRGAVELTQAVTHWQPLSDIAPE